MSVITALHILVVGDSADDCRLIERELAAGGFQAATERVETPESMSAALTNKQWDAVIAFDSKSEFHGLAALALFKSELSGIPFVLVSDAAGEGRDAEAMRAGANECIPRNDLAQLVPAIQRGLRAIKVHRAHLKAEADLREAEARYRALVEQSLVGVYMLGDNEILYLNEAGANLFGYQVEEIVGRLEPLAWVHPDDRPRVLQKIEEGLSGPSVELHFTFQGLRKDGKSVFCEAFGRCISFQGRSAIVGTLVDMTEQKRSEEQLKRSQQDLRALASRLQGAHEEEKTQIAREIHDELGQTLTGIKFELARMGKAGDDKQKLHTQIESINRLVDDAIQTVRRIASELRPGVLDELGLAAAIEWQAGDFEKRTGIPCKVQLPSDELDLDLDRSTAVFRVFQETLTNVLRHARATRVEVTLKRENGSVLLEVQDNGDGIADSAIENSQSIGLLGMRERVTSFGGEFRISGSCGKGTRVTVRLPRRQPGERLTTETTGIN